MAVAITEDLVSRATAGDVGAITDLLSLTQTDIRRYARRSCRNHSDAEEAVQETVPGSARARVQLFGGNSIVEAGAISTGSCARDSRHSGSVASRTPSSR